jgi:hypothetical protein
MVPTRARVKKQKDISMSMSRTQVINHFVAVRSMEYNAALTAQAITSQTDNKTTRANYEHYQKTYKV